jgi:hypothetical protein
MDVGLQLIYVCPGPGPVGFRHCMGLVKLETDEVHQVGYLPMYLTEL